MAKIGAISVQGKCFSQDEVILIVLAYWATTKPEVKFEALNYLYIKNIVKGFVNDKGVDAVDKLPADLLVHKQDLLSVCRGMF